MKSGHVSISFDALWAAKRRFHIIAWSNAEIGLELQTFDLSTARAVKLAAPVNGIYQAQSVTLDALHPAKSKARSNTVLASTPVTPAAGIKVFFGIDDASAHQATRVEQ